jgi:hypothetical protein
LKKYIPHIVISLVVIAAIVLFVIDRNLRPKKFNNRLSFRKIDKIPYGLFVAYQNLQHLFPHAEISVNKQEPGYWDSLSSEESDQALVIISPNFNADEYEMKKLISFVESGNEVFISARYISEDAERMLKCETSIFGVSSFLRNRVIISEDTLTVSLYQPPFPKNAKYSYPGRNFNSWAYSIDSSITEKIGGDELDHVNFLHFRAGRGHLYFHLAPLAFSNYFLLHKKNIEYYEKTFSLLSPSIKKIAWDEYYLRKRFTENEEKSGWMKVLFRFPELKAALLTAILTLLLFVLIEMRRKQRHIPVMAKPRNDSLDFVKTIGRLYHDKSDHKNLCHKMSSYFLEYIRTRFNLLTNKLDQDFIKSLHIKSGYPENEISEIVSFINYLEGSNAISDDQLISYHKKLESFYQNT